MTTLLHSLLHYFDTVLHPINGKNEGQKSRRRAATTAYHFPASPDCQNMRSLHRRQDSVRRSPAP